MNKPAALAMLCSIIFMVGFTTWQFYQGNLAAAMSTLPFLAIVYLFMINRRTRE
jgi:hypothetical protein